MNVLGIDIGGSALKAAPVDTRTGRLLEERHQIAMGPELSPRQVGRALAELVRHFRWRGPIGIGMPGIVHGTRIVTVVNLHRDFIGCDVGKVFAEATGCRVAVTNDAAAAGLAEMKFGAGRGFAGKALILTLGTGIGSALAYQGIVVPCELGQLPWRGRTVEKYVAAAVRERRDLSWPEWGGRLREYVHVLEEILWPELIIIGGGVSVSHRQFFKYIGARARLVPAEFYNGAGIVGAALWGAGGRL